MAPFANGVDLEKGLAAAGQTPRRASSLGVQFNTVKPGMILPGMDYAQRMFHYTYSSADEILFMEFRLLQRLNLVELQNELARIKAAVWSEMSASEGDLKKLRITMHEYVTAIRDFQYFQRLGECDEKDTKDYREGLTDAFDEIASQLADPYHSNYRFLEDQEKPARFDALRDSLRKGLHRSLAYSKEEKRRRPVQYYVKKKPPAEISPFVDGLARFTIAFVSGASLIIPMVVMSLNKSLTKSLVTTSIAVLILAGFLSFVIRAPNAETIIATAGYAAVLVVFVGVAS